MQKNLAKNEEKPCSTCLKSIFRMIPGTRKTDFGHAPIRFTPIDNFKLFPTDGPVANWIGSLTMQITLAKANLGKSRH